MLCAARLFLRSDARDVMRWIRTARGHGLSGVFGRKAGGVAGFTYSAGLKNSGVTWTDATLERWLSDPDMVEPDNNMSFSVPKAEERRDLIAYLKQ
jgi:cytochrome c